jgi:ATP-binding cassette, subfamily F, member 3
MLSVFAHLQAVETRMRDLEQCMADGEDVLEEYGNLLEQYEASGGYDYPLRIEQTLSGLGFDKSHYELPLSILSGGQKTRALLAKLLLERPDLLILDEPTNHLDIEAIRWLETVLRNWNGTLLIVSHDRYFLDVVVDTIWELSRNGLLDYRGNYSAYLRQREERCELAEKIFAQEKERLENEFAFIKKHITRPSTQDIAYGKMRRISRDLVAIQQMGIMAYTQSKSWSETGLGGVRTFTVAEIQQAIKGLENPVKRQPRLNMALKSTLRGGTMVLTTQKLCVGYPGNPLFMADDIHLLRGEVAALIGGNGTGKTTLLKTLLNEIPALEGKVNPGVGLKIGYFAQAHNNLNLENSVLDELMSHKAMPVSQARSWLARYLFRADDVFKTVGALSGGERAKLALAIMALEGANFLLLDEPTNHLDIQAQEILQEVLEAFDGTILLVTHDRYLVNRLATQIWSLDDGHLRIFRGNYREFLAENAA